MHKRDVLKMKAIRSIQPSDWTNFKKHRNYVNGQIKRAKVTYYHNAFFNNNNNNIFISYIKYTSITPPANSKANRGRWCVDGLRFITNS